MTAATESRTRHTGPTTVALFGPITDAYGGSGVGGLATHGTQVAEALPAHGVRVSYLADNLRQQTAATPWGTLHGVEGARGRAEAIRLRLSAPIASRAIYDRASSDPERAAHSIPVARAFSRAWLIARACSRDAAHVLHIQQPDYRPLFARWAQTGLPTLLAVHGLGVADADPGGPVARLVAENLAQAEMLTAPSRFLADAAIALGAPAERMHIVPNAVDHDLFAPRDPAECRSLLGLDPNRPLAVFLGRAIEMKGAHDLIEAAARLRERDPSLQVAFVGTWGIEMPVEATRYENGTDAPLLLREGAPKHELPAWLCAADVVVVPSRYEGFGLVALEALACARPVVLSRVGGLPEVVPEGIGVFTGPGDPESLAEGIWAVLSAPERALTMAAAGPAIASQYSWSATAQRFSELYEELVSRTRPS